MRAELYAVLFASGSRQWRVSLEMAADYAFWANRQDVTALLEVRPTLPAAAACMLRDEMNGSAGRPSRWAEAYASERDRRNGPAHTVRDIPRRFMRDDSTHAVRDVPALAVRCVTAQAMQDGSAHSVRSEPKNAMRDDSGQAVRDALRELAVCARKWKKRMEPGEPFQFRVVHPAAAARRLVPDSPLETAVCLLEQCRIASDDALGAAASAGTDEREGVMRRFLLMIEGRSLIPQEIVVLLKEAGEARAETLWRLYVQSAVLHGMARLEGGFTASRKGWKGWMGDITYRCRRCGGGKEAHHRTFCSSCGRECLYCEACLEMGRVRFCTPMMIGGVRRSVRALGGSGPMEEGARWSLSPAQKQAVAAALDFLRSRRPDADSPSFFLLWAVTGAGKTEMMFPIIQHALENGLNVLIATPRRDVVLELGPRIGAAFPSHPPVVLYGGSEQRWASGRITLATTHQLLRFEQKFDLAIIDELDAFPYHNNPMLQYAAAKACVPGAARILLTATPPAPLRRQAERGKLAYVKVPVRYHGHPLPVPRLLRTAGIARMLQKGAVSRTLLQRLKHSVERGAQVFVFCPRTDWTEPLAALLGAHLPGVAVAGTSSKDRRRAEQVAAFRDRRLRILVTTTILERGVTVGKADVFILDADSSLFDDTSLVQMAGRAGRSAQDPHGSVWFAAPQMTRSIRAAIRQIRDMNRLAGQMGYFNGKS